jgi:hypothetical protein
VSGVFFSCFNAQNNTGWAGLGWGDKTRRDETICSTRRFHREDVMTVSISKELR